MITITDLVKSYGAVKALDRINLQVNKGELFGLIGPDGAGKTTLFRILATLIAPDEGSVTLDSWNITEHIREIRSSIGYMPGRFSLYQDLTVEENLEFFATVFGTTISENYDLIKPVYSHIEPFKNRRAGALSGGMKQKLALSCALIHRPGILLLDEPTFGVDPVSRKELWDMLKKLKDENITILVSTPYMDEAALCDRIGLIQKGQLIAADTPENVKRSFSARLIEVKSSGGMYRLIEDLRYYDRAKSYFAFGETIHYTDKTDDETAMPELTDYLTRQGHRDLSINEITPDVEDRFMELMAETAND